MTYVVIATGFLQVEHLFNSVNTPQEEHLILTGPQIVSFHNGCLWIFFWSLLRSICPKHDCKNILKNNHCKTICGPISSECSSYRVGKIFFKQ